MDTELTAIGRGEAVLVFTWDDDDDAVMALVLREEAVVLIGDDTEAEVVAAVECEETVAFEVEENEGALEDVELPLLLNGGDTLLLVVFKTRGEALLPATTTPLVWTEALALLPLCDLLLIASLDSNLSESFGDLLTTGMGL